LPQYKLTYKPYGAHSILIEWPTKIHNDILNDVLCFKQIIENKYVKEKVQVKSAYSSLLVFYVLGINNIYDKISTLKSAYEVMNGLNKPTFKRWNIPVCYDDEFGIDLDEISSRNNISKSDIIRLHSTSIYTVYFIGFLPGFLYLGGLKKELYIPRKSTPRLAVEKGAIAIGGNQTGVYPNASPGGWNIIGNTPIDFFEANSNPPCFAKAGDQIQFYPISRKEHSVIKKLVEAGVYQLESEVLDD
jgi:inhibitor of KinA